MLFKKEFHEGLATGDVTLTFRLWSRPQAKPGGRYRCWPIGWLEVDAVDRVTLGEISDAEARRAGFADRSALVAFLEKTARKPLPGTTRVFRVELHYAGPDEEPPLGLDDALTAEDTAELSARLARMDRLSRHGPWTAQTLTIIEENPRTAASRLAPRLGRETRPFKVDVRKLKKLGLTLSFEVGYEISPRGRAFLSAREK